MELEELILESGKPIWNKEAFSIHLLRYVVEDNHSRLLEEATEAFIGKRWLARVTIMLFILQ